jgi:hypothetical protein
MTVHLYLSLLPEALIASMLTPEEFGHYSAVGSKYLTRGQVMFYELDPEFRHPYFDIENGLQRCVPHEDGSPKNSVYISTYRVLEHIAVSAVGDLHLTTSFGQVFTISRGEKLPPDTEGYHLYQDLAPVPSLVVSGLNPLPYYQSITVSPQKLISFPALAFVELALGNLASDPEFGEVGDLPYSGIPHIRECLMELKNRPKDNKLVDRINTADFPYRTVKSGFYIGNGYDLAYYPMPSHDDLRVKHHHWWRMANL